MAFVDNHLFRLLRFFTEKSLGSYNTLFLIVNRGNLFSVICYELYKTILTAFII